MIVYQTQELYLDKSHVGANARKEVEQDADIVHDEHFLSKKNTGYIFVGISDRVIFALQLVVSKFGDFDVLQRRHDVIMSAFHDIFKSNVRKIKLRKYLKKKPRVLYLHNHHSFHRRASS